MLSATAIQDRTAPRSNRSPAVGYLDAHPGIANTLVAVAYVAAGYPVLALAAAPPHPGLIAPSAGIALAAMLTLGYRLWPGVLVGSLALSLIVTGGALSADAVGPAMSNAVGACLQAAIGTWLLHRLGYPGGAPTSAAETWTVLGAGIASCFVATGWGLLTLAISIGGTHSAHSIDLLGRFVGDALGIVAMIPVVLVAAEGGRLRRLGYIAVPVIGVSLIVTLALGATFDAGSHRIRLQFERAAGDLVRAVGFGLTGHLDRLHTLEAFFAGSERVERVEFQRFVAIMLRDAPGLQALAWAPRVPHSERATLVNHNSTEGRARGITALSEFEILESGPSGELHSAQRRPEYYPILFIEPFAGNEERVGLDLGASSARLESLHAAASQDRPLLLDSIDLDNGETGFMVPVHAHPDPFQGSEHLLGFAVALLQLRPLIDLAAPRRHQQGLSLTIDDVTDDTSVHTQLYVDPDAPFVNGLDGRRDTVFEQTLPVATRHWLLRVHPNRHFHEQHRQPMLWLVLPAGLLLVTLTSGFTLVMSGRFGEVKALVAQKTRELEQRNHELAARATELVQRNSDLSRTNEDLDRFAYSASHDLRAPLRGIDQLAGWVLEDCADLLPEKSHEHLMLLQDRAQRMQTLLEGLLEYSRAGRSNDNAIDVQTLLLVRDAIDLCHIPPGIEARVQTPMPLIRSARAPLLQVMQNLIGNAVKHHDTDTGLIEIGARPVGDGRIEFSVCDDGPGIPETQRERVFEMFQTLRSRDDGGGSGMGLAIVRKVVERNGGQIWIEDGAGRGTCFRFTWPAYTD